MKLPYILMEPSATEIAKKIKLTFTKSWISFLSWLLPFDVYKEEDGESEAKDDLKMEEEIVGNRNDSTGTDLRKKPGSDLFGDANGPSKSSKPEVSKKPGSDLFCDANGPSKSLKPEADLKPESMKLPYILMEPSATEIAKKIKLTFTKSWISFLGWQLPFDVYKEEDGESEAKDDLKMEEQIVGNRNDSTGTDLRKKPGSDLFGDANGPSKSSKPEVSRKPGSDLFCDANGPSKSLKPEADLKAESMKLPYILMEPSATEIAKKIKLTFTKSWISFLSWPLPFDVYNEESSKETATRGLLRSHHLRCRLLLLLLVASLFSATVPVALGEVGTAAFYGPPYDWTECYGGGSSQFPESNLFAAVGDELWDMGDACGREYEVRCTSGCKPGSGAIRVKIVNYALSVGPRQSVTGADLVLSQTAYEAIANLSMDSISVEFERV